MSTVQTPHRDGFCSRDSCKLRCKLNLNIRIFRLALLPRLLLRPCPSAEVLYCLPFLYALRAQVHRQLEQRQLDQLFESCKERHLVLQRLSFTAAPASMDTIRSSVLDEVRMRSVFCVWISVSGVYVQTVTLWVAFQNAYWYCVF